MDEIATSVATSPEVQGVAQTTEIQPGPYYHGGVPFLKVGSEILPPSLTGARQDYDADVPSHIEEKNAVRAAYKETYRNDRVFITSNLRLAMLFAVLHRSHAGQCYEVEPLGEIEADPGSPALPGCPEIVFQCSSARVVCIVLIQHHVRTTILNEHLEITKAQTHRNGIKVAGHKLKQSAPTSEQEQRNLDRRRFEKKQRKLAQRARKRG